MDSAKTTFNLLSLCTGIRGIERGLERVIPNLRTVCAVEIESVVIENLAAEIEAGMVAPYPIWSNLKTFDPTPFRGLVDIITGGYPCQPFSTAGKRKGTDDPRHLFPYIERAIRIIRPSICFFENVRGHVTSGLPEVIEALEGLGYRVRWGIYSAEETGAAHKRERVFILAMADSAITREWRRQWDIHQENGRQDGELSFEPDGTSEELENPSSVGLGSFRAKSERLKRSAIAHHAGDEELADDHGQRQSQSQGNIRESGEWSGNGSQIMGNADNTGLQGRIIGECEERPGEWLTRQNGPFCRVVARPGHPQHEWEYPRTTITDESARLLGGYCEKYPEAFQAWQIEQVARDGFAGKVKSDVGLTAHGFPFREDFLRALGNAVYWPSAELAFRDLLRQHNTIPV